MHLTWNDFTSSKERSMPEVEHDTHILVYLQLLCRQLRLLLTRCSLGAALFVRTILTVGNSIASPLQWNACTVSTR